MTFFTYRAQRSVPARLRPAALAVAIASTSPAWAQQDDVFLLAQNTHLPSLSETVVSATRTEQPLSDLVADVSIIDRSYIERSGVTALPDVLARLPGIEITRNGGLGNAANVFVRGSEGRFVAVYVDGVRIDSQATGGAQWEQIPLSQIDRIEVLRGPAAAVYGSDAIGGVIQLFTRKGEGKPAPYVGVGIGTQNTRKIEAGISGVVGEGGAIDYALGIARAQSDGYDIRSSAGHNPDKDDHISNAGHARLGFQVNAKHRVEATLLANNMESGYDISPEPVDDRNHNRLRTAGVSWSAQWSDAFSSRLSATHSSNRYATSPSLYLTETQLRGYLWQNEYRVGPHRFSASLERREDALDNPAMDAWSKTIVRDRSQNALALGYGYRSGAHTVQANLRHDNDSEFGGKNTGSIAYGFSLTPQWRATASAGTAFRVPTLYQRFSEYGDASLRPESSRNVEAGLRYTSGVHSATATVYRNRVGDLISFVGSGPCGAVYGCYANTARAEYRGVTLAGSTKLAGVQLHGSLDFQRPRDLDTGLQLSRRARRHASFAAETEMAGWTWGGELQLSGARFDDAANTTRLGGYGLVNLYASTRVARDFTLLARVDNVGDKHYEVARAYVPPGRSVYVGVKWTPAQ
jgi:vitamin B12 transporter